MCNDGAPTPRSLEAARAHYDGMAAAFDWGSMWAGLRISCSRVVSLVAVSISVLSVFRGWLELPKNHFQGEPPSSTVFPILCAFTPLAAAEHMSKGFAGSVVLTQDSPGHCSVAALSLCTQQYIRDHFFSGTLPDPSTVCPVMDSPFLKATSLEDDKQAMFLADERRRLFVARELTRSFGAPRWGPLARAEIEQHLGQGQYTICSDQLTNTRKNRGKENVTHFVRSTGYDCWLEWPRLMRSSCSNLPVDVR
ncbi:uncharacterized protein BT62DRAFT_32362 [Guyanagaster necrorhizus]|uniref:Peptidase S33 tripeptidyl aminopeptidase-like C-terminal domain-containing protein n=1 Tax=Guyanagaster necrorhizus TaxID=856835 RepID=A0A9P8AZ37_9AGAR|nr:uncharacterized protein BT62DRAFT_32362 [Guyanagaster necrorhizus MCA 3950]KAG7452871.1 hypothetical protein BT62DRAFT_32362 [Guyanagaster necrorhizus MCA 3950]